MIRSIHPASRLATFLSVALLTTLMLQSMPRVSAALVYEVGFDQPSFSVDQGQDQIISVLFREISERGSGDNPKLALGGNDGIFSPSFVLDFGGLATDRGLGIEFEESDFNLNASLLDPAFSTVTLDSALNRLTVIGQARELTGVEIAPRAEGVNDIFEFEIGTLNITNLGGDGDLRTLALAQPNVPFSNDFADFSGTPTIRFGSATVGTTAVPEPSSLTILLLAGTATVFRRFRRRSQTCAVASPE